MVTVPVCVPDSTSEDDGDRDIGPLSDGEAPKERDGDGEVVGEAGITT